MTELQLTVVGGPVEEECRLLTLPAILGRGSRVGLHLPHPLISRYHCELFEKDGQIWVRDLGSTNGTFVGTDRISESTIEHGQLLTIGTITFRLVLGEQAVVADFVGGETRADVASEPGCSADSAETDRLGTPKSGRQTRRLHQGRPVKRTSPHNAADLHLDGVDTKMTDSNATESVPLSSKDVRG